MWLPERFKFAWQGFCYGICHDSSIRLQIILGLVTLLAGAFFQVSRFEWMILLICIALVIGMEFLNSAIENCVDYISTAQNSKAGIIKDLAAGAVLVVSFFSFLIACLIFIPYVEKLIHF